MIQHRDLLKTLEDTGALKSP